MPYTTISGLQVDVELANFVAEDLLPALDITAEQFWATFAELESRFAPQINALLGERDEFQQAIDAWVQAEDSTNLDDYEKFLTEIGYLEPIPQVQISTENVDPEITEIAGPQLVVPATVPRYALNAANARWGSLFDALYGTDIITSDFELARGYDRRRGEQVFKKVDELLDEYFPLTRSFSHADVIVYIEKEGHFRAITSEGMGSLVDPSQFAGLHDDGFLLQRNGIHWELQIHPEHPVGCDHHASVSDVITEAAITTIVDLEDSVATVDGEDKALAYGTWLGLLRGDLSSTFEKDGKQIQRVLNPDRDYEAPDGSALTLPGRSLLFARIVGNHMTTGAVLHADGSQIIECVLDAWVCAVAGLYDLRSLGSVKNSRTGSIYIVKPKQHGAKEVALTVELFAAIEAALGLPADTIKIGIMDEERRTSLNLAACIEAAASRVVFINTGFLDRTGDEIHTDFAAGPVVRKGDMKSSIWLNAYEDHNVDVGLSAGLPGHAQIGKGMWAKPAAMADMLREKVGHPLAGGNCAWVPSPTAATLHALHYLKVDVKARQQELVGRNTSRREMLRIPLQTTALTPDQIDHELRTNAQSILGYVVRWVGLGIGCSTVPDLEGVGLMEDRATLRISSQLIANWLAHGIVNQEQVRNVFADMAVLVDSQNAKVEGYPPMHPNLAESESFQAALELVFNGRTEPNGYTERALTGWRLKAKQR